MFLHWGITMNLDFYRNFVIVAESYTVSEAARRLNIAQPALSAQIKRLESYYGVQLIKTRQGSRHLELTAAGELLYRRMRHILNATDVLRTDLKMVAFNELETVAIGTVPDLSMAVGEYVTDFVEQHPDRRWRIMVNDLAPLAEHLERGEIHCIMTPFAASQAFMYTLEGAFTRPIYAIGEKDHPLLKDKQHVRMASLTKDPICLATELEDGFFRGCREEHVEIPVGIRCTSTATVVDVALRCHRIAVIAGDVSPWLAPYVTAVPLRSKYLRAEHYVYTQKGSENPKVMRQFLDYLKARKDYQPDFPRSEMSAEG